MAERHLIVFARAPALGRVKRRLAKGVGRVAALRVYRALLRRTLRELRPGQGWRCWLALTPDDRSARRAVPWRMDGWTVIPQGRGDLGARMARALAAPPPGPAILVGSDIPALRASHVRSAFAALGRAGAVFGPAEDGGFWLVGFRRSPFQPNPFRGVTWSAPTTLDETLERLDRRCSFALAATLADLDEA